MKHYIFIFCAILALLFCPSCIREEEPDNTPVNNFETLWRIIDTQYCFHDYKAQEGCLPWNEVYAKYRPRVHDGMTSAQLFEVLCDMLSELRDGHVNLYSAADVGRYWSWHEDYPSNFNDSIHQVYLGTDYRIAAGMYYKILDDNIGYIYYGSFSSGIGEGNLDEVMYYLRLCNGLIVDVRNNSGGTLTYAERLAERFTNEKRLVGYIAHKTGTGHNDFSSPEAEYIEPSKGIRWQKKAIVLTNRSCYSATNTFVRDMKECPLVTIMGDRTGGGSGLPFSSELPNGWSIRFSASPMFDPQMNQLEFGNDVVAMERFDLTALVKNYIQSAAILTKQHEITVRMEEYPPIYAWADEFKIEEVFMNFFSNAVNHCEDDKIIEVKMEQKDGKVRVSVFNTGKPIPEDSIHHIWEKFYKVDKARTREYGGSGVGLSIVKAIMESMNQQFGVNNYNNGVEFWFELETK